MANPNGAVAGNAQNIPEAHVPRTRSTFPLHQLFPNTHRFGEYIPHYVDDLTKDDNYPVHSSGSVRSYTFKSPLLQNVKRNKDYFLVPMEAILPNNWEKFFVNPIYGDDVSDDVGPTVANFWNKVGTLMDSLDTSIRSILSNTSLTNSVKLTALFRYIVLGEYFYSNGNLLSSLGCHGAPYIYVEDDLGEQICWDDFFDIIVDIIQENLLVSSQGAFLGTFTLQVDNYIYVVSGRDTEYGLPAISLRHALQLMRDNPTFVFTNVTYSNGWSSLLSEVSNVFNDFTFSFQKANVPCNLSRLWAYQLSCAHYFTNDHVDFVYSAELYRQLIGSYLRYIYSAGTYFLNSSRFSRNGISYEYDFLSAHFCSDVLTNAVSVTDLLTNNSSNSSSQAVNILGYFSALLGYRRSLRYLDYFTGSRPVPLAVYTAGTGLNGGVSTDVYVNGSQVSVIDITKSIQAQRFLNSVNRIGHQFEDYLKGIFGGSMPAPDYHNPFYLARTSDTIFGQETENTATEQMNDKIAITTNLRSNSGNYMFDCHSDRPGILIGITSYDIPRVYTKSMERSFLHQNRFDWFNPFMQYIGDQSIYIQELGIQPGTGYLNSLTNFSYTLRHMEFKQKFNYAAGAFCNPKTDLDLWIFGAKDRRGNQANINPDWIRSLNAEFDQFYVSLTGWSLGTYFHFIVADYNSVNASRPMAYSPQILG